MHDDDYSGLLFWSTMYVQGYHLDICQEFDICQRKVGISGQGIVSEKSSSENCLL